MLSAILPAITDFVRQHLRVLSSEINQQKEDD